MLLPSKFQTPVTCTANSLFSRRKATASAFDDISLSSLLSPYWRYLITLILLCRLVQQVDVIPPSIKSLQFGRFLGCGEIPLEPWNKITSLKDPRKKDSELSFCFRIPIARKGCGSDLLCHPGGVPGCPPWTNHHGRLPNLLPALACYVSSRRWIGRGRTGTFPVLCRLVRGENWRIETGLPTELLSMTDCRLCLQVRLPKMIKRRWLLRHLVCCR